jgi:hypothetical protein
MEAVENPDSIEKNFGILNSDERRSIPAYGRLRPALNRLNWFHLGNPPGMARASVTRQQRSLADDPALVEEQLMRDKRQSFVSAMGCVNELAAARRNRFEHLQQAAPKSRIEPIADFVQEKNRGRPHHRARDQHLAQLAGRECLHVASEQWRHAELERNFLHTPALIGGKLCVNEVRLGKSRPNHVPPSHLPFLSQIPFLEFRGNQGDVPPHLDRRALDALVKTVEAFACIGCRPDIAAEQAQEGAFS